MTRHITVTAYFAAAAAASVVAGCAASSSTAEIANNDFTSLNGASVEIVAEGGIAALTVTHRAEHDSRAFAFSQQHICGTTCAAPMDSASGVLSPATADSMFTIVLEQAR